MTLPTAPEGLAFTPIDEFLRLHGELMPVERFAVGDNWASRPRPHTAVDRLVGPRGDRGAAQGMRQVLPALRC